MSAVRVHQEENVNCLPAAPAMKREADRLDQPQRVESPVSCHVGTRSSH